MTTRWVQRQFCVFGPESGAEGHRTPVVPDYRRVPAGQRDAGGRDDQFIDSQIDDVRERIIAYEQKLEGLRAHNGRRPLSQADLLPYEVLQERYRTLLIRRGTQDGRESRRRQIGEQFRSTARVPERPVGPSRLEREPRGHVRRVWPGSGLCRHTRWFEGNARGRRPPERYAALAVIGCLARQTASHYDQRSEWRAACAFRDEGSFKHRPHRQPLPRSRRP